MDQAFQCRFAASARTELSSFAPGAEARSFDPPRSHERAQWLARHVVPHEPALRAWLHRRRIDGLETDDVVQETYAVLAALACVDHIGSPRAYAFQTAQSVIWRHLRRIRVVRIEGAGDVDALSLPLDQPSPEREVASRQELRFVALLIHALPPKCREAFVLRKLEGLSQREVGRRMQISERTVEKHTARALQMLARGLARLTSDEATPDVRRQTRVASPVVIDPAPSA